MTNDETDTWCEINDDLNNGNWADLTLQLSGDFDAIVDSLVDQILEAEGLTRNRTNLRNLKNALSFLLSNLLQFHLTDARAYCLVGRSNGFYRSSPYNPNSIGTRALRRCFGFLRDNRFIEVRGGNFNRSGEGSPGGMVTRCRARESLLVALSPPGTTEGSIGEGVTPGITRNTNFINDINSIESLHLFQRAPLPIVRMKNEQKELIEPPHHDDVERMTSNLHSINSCLEDHWIDLCIPDDQLPTALTNRAVDENGAPGERTNLRTPFNLAMQRTLYRVFNNETFDNGGRFYGGWWQQIKSRYRKFITINWHPVSEIDYSNMQAAMLYAREGLELPNDAYLIDGIPNEYRKLIKTTFFKLINAEGQIRRPRQSEMPDGWTFEQIMEALREKHAPIAGYFNTGIGIELQRIDSDIAETVVLRMMNEGQLVLPVHDSFIVRTGHEELLRHTMHEVYADMMGHEVQLETDPVWIEELTDEEDELLHHLGVRHISENFSDLIHSDEYSRYNQRRWDFVGHKGEEWGHTRQWFNE